MSKCNHAFGNLDEVKRSPLAACDFVLMVCRKCQVAKSYRQYPSGRVKKLQEFFLCGKCQLGAMVLLKSGAFGCNACGRRVDKEAT